MSAESSEEKEHEASPKKLEEARRKGEIAKSTDLITAASYAGFLVATTAFGGMTVVAVGNSLSILLAKSDNLAVLALRGSLQSTLGGIVGSVILSLLPLFAIPAAFAVLSIIGQQSFVVAPSKLVPKLNRISLLAGIKNKFGRQGLFEFGKSLFKLLIFLIILGFYLGSEWNQILATLTYSPQMISLELGRMAKKLLLIVFVVSVFLGILDYLFQLAEHRRKNRMSRKELMDELKSTEGDPATKQRRRQMGMDIASQQMLSDVPQASVVIVNPTHYAVALQWSVGSGGAPICVAKGLDEVAARIRQIAVEHAVPIHSDPPTARALHATVGIGEAIEPDHFQAVAIAIRFSQKMRQKVKHM